ncbi:hypothetical protein Tco_1122997 [Tanacetum coccineum]|uniref:Uncharacterized protein n=1 Tax=Tanacetum coccineum TaxID=301880 RepID=A0ABQ5J240_9ASTR
MWGCRGWLPERGGWRVEERVRESEYDEWVDPVTRIIFGVRRKTPPEKFSGGGDVVVAGKLAGEDGGGRVVAGRRNYGVTCEEEAKRRNSRAYMKTFEEYYFLHLYAVSSNEDTAYQRQLSIRNA